MKSNNTNSKVLSKDIERKESKDGRTRDGYTDEQRENNFLYEKGGDSKCYIGISTDHCIKINRGLVEYKINLFEHVNAPAAVCLECPQQ